MSGPEAINIADIAKLPGLFANTKLPNLLFFEALKRGDQTSHHRGLKTVGQVRGHSHVLWFLSAIAVIECSLVIRQLVWS